MDSLEYKESLIKKIEERDEFSILEDGYIYYFPSNNGALQSNELRIIADELDNRNKPWDDEITKMLEKIAAEDSEDPLFLSRDSSSGKLILIILLIFFWIFLALVGLILLGKYNI